MRITNSSIQMEAASYSVKRQSSIEQLNVWGNPPLTNDEQKPFVSVDLSEQGRQLAENISQTNAADDGLFVLTDEEKGKIKLLSDLIYMLTGKRIKFVIPKELKKLTLNPRPVTVQRQGWGISYQFSSQVHEEEKMSFHTNGTVKTADGREIQLDLKLNMSRSFTSSTNISFKAGDALIDPLVINLKGTGTSLGSKSFEFDLDADGKMDRIAFTNEGSGFLALDKNKNGKVDDGTELFGPTMGNGFAELALYDDDQNGWIDENDEVYHNLSIWMREDGGEPQLIALGQAGVGAIYLGHVESAFALKDTANNDLGQIRQSGIFLFENGTAGTIQHVDLAI